MASRPDPPDRPDDVPDWRAGAAPMADPPVGRGLSQPQADRASRRYWDQTADDYQARHGRFLAEQGRLGFVWGPEGVTERSLRLLGPPQRLRSARVLEVGCGAAQCCHWLADQGASAVGIDISVGQLRHAPRAIPVVAARATALPFDCDTFDVAFSAYGAVQFVADLPALLREVHRVLRADGTFVFSVTHPVRWAFPDDPGPDGLRVSQSYFDRTPYVERSTPDGEADYAEFHRTLGDYVTELRRCGFSLETLTEPEWPAWNQREWGGWSPRRGRLLPGTLILGCRAAPPAARS